MKCELTECGHTNCGLRVRAITDAMGAQVVETDDSKPENDSLLSEPLDDHAAAVELGKIVVESGTTARELLREKRRRKMKVVIFSDVVAEKEPEVHLRLVYVGESVNLFVVNPRTGEEISSGAIAHITQKGTLLLYPNVSPSIGLQLDDEGRIKLD